MKSSILRACWLALALPLIAAAATIYPTDLRCEYRWDPTGVDSLHPRLSWVLKAVDPSARNLRQAIYRVLVATSPDKLRPGDADLWDSGPVFSDQSVQVPYEGKPLQSGEQVFWKVRVWDQGGYDSPWSETARWTMGLLKPSDWLGKWIGLDKGPSPVKLEGTSWIWFPEGKPATAAPLGTRYFRRAFTLPADRPVKSAHLLIAADNQFTAYVNGNQVGSGRDYRVVQDFDVSAQLKPGANLIAVAARNVGNAPNPAGLTALLRVEFKTGEPMVLPTDASWKASKTEVAGWEKPTYDDSSWAMAKKLGDVGMAPWQDLGSAHDRRLPARMLRREFSVGKHIRRATAYICGLGLSELYLNGQKVGDHVLSPGLTDYPKRDLYVTYEVGQYLHPGINAIGVWLGNGRFYAPRLNVPTKTRSYGYPKLMFQLHIEYTDGTSDDVVSDQSWRITTNGPIRANNTYDGEVYDARKEMPGWASPGFDDSQWKPVQLVSAPGGKLVSEMSEPIRVTETIHPISMKELRPGVYIYDMGQNMVGWCRLRVSGPRGTHVTLRFAETLKPDGSLYTANLRSAKATDVYILKGQGEEVYEPRFTYHGFRYVELTGYPGTPTLDTLEGRVVHDDLESAGDWVCSQPMLNRIYQNVRWGVRGNYRSIPTDCPQRDERQGWLGDRSEVSLGNTYLFYTAPLLSKWIQDMADSQKASGSVPDVCPPYWPIYTDNVVWPSSTIIIPDHVYVQFHDRRIIARHYPSMKKWITYMTHYMTNGLMPRDTYGDWCVPPEKLNLIHSTDPKRQTNHELLGSAYFYHCLDLMSQFATILGKTEDAQHYHTMAMNLRQAFNNRFLHPKAGYYDNGSQTSCVLPLAFDMVPRGYRQKVFQQLVTNIVHESHSHIGTGLVGGQWLMRTLTAMGRPDLAYTIATNTTYPSWGYMVKRGATTIWELWNGDTANPAMNSRNHVMLVGDLIIWMYQDLAGIAGDPAHPGFHHIIMKPHPTGNLHYVMATHLSPYGWISSYWRRGADGFHWSIQVPVNTTATVYVPSKATTDVTESGVEAAASRDVQVLRYENGYTVVEVGSGHYSFASH